MYKLIYPTVNLFLYDLRDGLMQLGETIADNQVNFWRKIEPNIDRDYKRVQEIYKYKDQILSKSLKAEAEALGEKILDNLKEFKDRENAEADFVELYYQSFAEQQAYLDGMYYGLQIGDTYALQVEASDVTNAQEPAKRTDTPRSLDQLSRLQELVISKINHHDRSPELDADKLGTLGQTWLVWGQAVDGKTTENELRAIAKDCFSELTPDKSWKPDFKEVGELIGARVFEYAHNPKDWENNKEKFMRENYHLVILLFPSSGTDPDVLRNRIAKITFDLIKLFAYRHKIIWSYWNSRYLKAELKKKSQKIAERKKQMAEYKQKNHNSLDKQALEVTKKKIYSRQSNLDNLEDNLKKSWLVLTEYESKLNQLQSQRQTIFINLDNFKKRLAKIEEDAINQPANLSAKLQILQNKFINTAEERYLKQVQLDHTSLGADLTEIQNLTRTLDSFVNIERTNATNRLNTTIAIAGLGLAASGAFAGIAATQVYPPANKSDDGIPWIQGLGFSLIPLAIILSIWLCFKKKR